jgi:hypothetical protein
MVRPESSLQLDRYEQQNIDHLRQFAAFLCSFDTTRFVSMASFLVRAVFRKPESRARRLALDLLTLNHRVAGSSPAAPTTITPAGQRHLAFVVFFLREHRVGMQR